MTIKKITLSEVAKMKGSEGLVLQGCGGDLREWVDGINKILVDEEIMKLERKFTDAFTFIYKDITCLLFSFENVELDVSKLAIWRLATREVFGSMWLSDFIDNYLVDAFQKPDCPLIGANGNIFNLIGIVSRTLKGHGLGEQATEMRERVLSSGSFDEALCIICEYVNIVSADDVKDE